MRVIAHRGSSAERPANSMAAFARAVEIGVDAIEADILITKDQRLVVMHDDIIKINGKWHLIHELTFEELQQVDLGDGERIISIEALLDRFQKKCQIVLDLKAFGTSLLLAKYLLTLSTQSNIHVSSFLHSEILLIGKQCPTIERSITLASIPIQFEGLFRDSKTQQVNLFRGYMTDAIVTQLHGMGARVLVYPVNLLHEAERFASWGVDGIYTDDPAAMQSIRS